MDRDSLLQGSTFAAVLGHATDPERHRTAKSRGALQHSKHSLAILTCFTRSMKWCRRSNKRRTVDAE